VEGDAKWEANFIKFGVHTRDGCSKLDCWKDGFEVINRDGYEKRKRVRWRN